MSEENKQTADKTNQRLGIVVSGSLTKGVEVRLDGAASVEDMAVGRYVTIQGQKQRFFGMITDVTLGWWMSALHKHRLMSPTYLSPRYSAVPVRMVCFMYNLTSHWARMPRQWESRSRLKPFPPTSHRSNWLLTGTWS